MHIIKLIFISSFVLILNGCSASYKKLSNMEVSEGNNFQEFLLYEYKEKARFEAEEMHDWNSAELYSQKALKSIENNKIYPEETTYWRLPEDKVKEIRNAYKNLITIYDDAMIVDPYNLAIAISSLDCWSEQQEENWQTWDIINCKDSFLNSIHKIYNKISKSEKRIETKEAVSKNKEEAIIVTKNKNDEIIQIVYFDFDKIELSDVSLKNIKKFLINNKKQINEYLIIGHTDTKGTKKYNLSLSIKRAEFVKNILINNGISDKKIDIFGKGEDFLALDTPDETKHPANRRVEIKKSN